MWPPELAVTATAAPPLILAAFIKPVPASVPKLIVTALPPVAEPVAFITFKVPPFTVAVPIVVAPVYVLLLPVIVNVPALA